jgi:hypothetical protein
MRSVAAGIDRGKQAIDLVGAAGVAGDRRRPGLGGELRQLAGVARRQHDIHPFPGGAAGQRCTQPRPCPDDQCPLALRHGLLLTTDGAAILAPAPAVIAQNSRSAPE